MIHVAWLGVALVLLGLTMCAAAAVGDKRRVSAGDGSECARSRVGPDRSDVGARVDPRRRVAPDAGIRA